jgi:hypothetical protein
MTATVNEVAAAPAPAADKPKPGTSQYVREKYADIMASFERLPDSMSIPISAVAAVECMSVPTVWRWMRVGLLPQPVVVGGLRRVNVGAIRAARLKRAGMPESEVRALLKSLRKETL